MTTKELIRAEIRKWQSIVEERCPESKRSRDYTKEEWNAIYEYNAYTRLLSFLDTLPDESEQPTRGYDEAYLNEKIAKASKSWEGVDVDKFMDEVRGREPVSDCHDLEEVAENSWAVYEYRESPKGLYSTCYVDGFIAGAEWQYQKDRGEFAKIKAKTWCEGFDACKEQMMEGAVVARVEADLDSHGADYGIRYIHIRMPDDSPIGDKVRIIILPKEEDNDRTIV